MILIYPINLKVNKPILAYSFTYKFKHIICSTYIYFILGSQLNYYNYFVHSAEVFDKCTYLVNVN